MHTPKEASQKGLNRGEWSEVYVFFHLLGEPCLLPCDEDLVPQPDEGISLPVAAIQRGATPEGPLHYTYMGDALKLWQIKAGERELEQRVETIEGKRESHTLLQALLNPSDKNKVEGGRGFVCQEASDFLRKLGGAPRKASSDRKEDIVLTLNDVRAGRKTMPECGFSIKSYLGGAPTLLNPSADHTNILYRVEGISTDDIDRLNQLKLGELITAITERGGSLHLEGLCGKQFEENLLLIDTCMPQLLGELLKVHYIEKIRGVREATERLAELNPLKLSRTDIYAHKVRELLVAVSLGMTPAKRWEGNENANGGFIIVTPDGDVVSYHLYDREIFREYVYRSTCLDHPSTSRYKYGRLYHDGSGIHLKLAIQIRFKDRNPMRVRRLADALA